MGGYGQQGSTLDRLDPATAGVKIWVVPFDYADPYDAAADHHDNIWIATDKHVVMFDQITENFTLNPTPVRTDIPRLTISTDGAIWFALRNGGWTGGHGAIASVLYPNRDSISTLKAFYHPCSCIGRHLTNYQGGQFVKVEGKEKFVDSIPRNPGAYARVLDAMGLSDEYRN